MLILTGSRRKQALEYIEQNARLLEKCLASYYFDEGSRDEVFRELGRYQDPDGGFGRALEPDVRYAGPTVLATTTALRILEEVEAPPDHPMVAGALRYLLRNYNPDTRSWFYLPPEAQESPRAPWWNWPVYPPEEWNDFVHKPRPEILGWLYTLIGGVDPGWREELLAETLFNLGAKSGELTRDDLISYLHLYASPYPPLPERKAVKRLLLSVMDRMLERDESRWADYCLKPIDVVTGPDSPFYEPFREEVEASLDYEIRMQGEDGSWGPYWSWGDDYPDAWPEARREWSGILTLRNLRVLTKFGRLE